MKELFKQKIDKQKITEVLYSEETLTIKLENQEEITFKSYHEQDCCESVYADFGVFKDAVKDMVGKEIDLIVIKPIEDMGFLLSFGLKDNYEDFIDYFTKVFVPCYDYQNGYYSDDLELIINIKGDETKINITNLAHKNY